jgi:HAD superfamily hydrolase (TIGR01509 family)
MADCVRVIERRLGRDVRETFVADVRRETALAFDAELKPVEGIHAALAEIAIPVCVASNGPMSKLTHTLGLTKLLSRFEGRIFSAYEVGSWKPDPGLFLHAAQTMGVHPSRCIVVEDSVSGIRAAKAAGMRVLGFTGGAIRELNWSWERSAKTFSIECVIFRLCCEIVLNDRNRPAKGATSDIGQSRNFGRGPAVSGLSRSTDILRKKIRSAMGSGRCSRWRRRKAAATFWADGSRLV